MNGLAEVAGSGSSWDEEVDFVVIGSGAGAAGAGLEMRRRGKTVLVLEKEARLGGSTAMSGGVLWIPNNPLMRRQGVPDSHYEARAYLDALVGDVGPASSPARRQTFLEQGPRFIEFMERCGVRFLRCEGWSDYHDELPGGKARGRSLACPLIDRRELGDLADKLRRHPRAPPMASHEIRSLMLMTRTIGGFFMAARMALRLARKANFKEDLLGMGAALQARFLKAALDSGVEIRTAMPVSALIESGGRVTGVEVPGEGGSRRIRARNGVLINAGGFAHNQRMRDAYGPPGLCEAWSASNPGDTGEIIEAAMGLGADIALMDEAWWIPSTLPPGGQPAHMVGDISKPHIIVVDSKARRIFNESASYMENGKRMIERNRTTPAIPAWTIFDEHHRSRYVYAGARPGQTPQAWIDNGFLKKADTLEELAEMCGLEPDALRATVTRFNGFAATGVDEDFQRGARAYDRCHGDPTVRPNPNLGAICKPPFYATQIYPGDAGTSGGLMTDEYARVLKADGLPIPGLYATGNSTASVFGRRYGGAGASIGASCVFAWQAAKHAADEPVVCEP